MLTNRIAAVLLLVWCGVLAVEAAPAAEKPLVGVYFYPWYRKPPAAKDDSKSGTFFTGGERYVDYGTLYLDILREETQR